MMIQSLTPILINDDKLLIMILSNDDTIIDNDNTIINNDFK